VPAPTGDLAAFVERQGALVVAGGVTVGEATVKLWDITRAGWKRLACRIANRNLTQQEWRQYLGDEPYQRRPCRPPTLLRAET
jgi:hypothetical protein